MYEVSTYVVVVVSRETMRKNKLSAGSRDMGRGKSDDFIAQPAPHSARWSPAAAVLLLLNCRLCDPVQHRILNTYNILFIIHAGWGNCHTIQYSPHHQSVQQSPSRHGEVCVETGTETRRHFSSKKNKKDESSLYIQEYPHSSMTFVLHATTRLANERSAALTSAFTHR